MATYGTLTVSIKKESPLRRLWLYFHCIYCPDMVFRGALHMERAHPDPKPSFTIATPAEKMAACRHPGSFQLDENDPEINGLVGDTVCVECFAKVRA